MTVARTCPRPGWRSPAGSATSWAPFAYVLASVSPRAVETAVAMGFAVDDTVAMPSGYQPREVAHHEQWSWPRPFLR